MKRQARICNKINCPINNSSICYRNKIVYKITCLKCNCFYIGYTKRYIHQRLKEHLQDSNSSLNKHLDECGNATNNITTSVVYQCNDVIDSQIAESYFIKRMKPSINSKEELSKNTHLVV